MLRQIEQLFCSHKWIIKTTQTSLRKSIRVNLVCRKCLKESHGMEWDVDPRFQEQPETHRVLDLIKEVLKDAKA